MAKLVNDITKSNISSLYNDYHPALKNLYTISITSLSKNSAEINDYAKFHASKITFNGEELKLKRHPITRQFIYDDEPYTYSNELTITWRESDNWAVKKYHEEWISRFYDRDGDCYYSYSSDSTRLRYLYRTLKIQFPESQNNSKEYDQDTLVFTYVLPFTTGNVDLEWSSDANIVTHTEKYYVTNWYWEKSKD